MEHHDRPSRLTLILTTRCNLSCDYCYQSVRGPRTIGLSDAKTAADLALSLPGRGTELTFYGGEPLLEFALLRRVVEHTECVRDPEEKVKYWVVTNGTLITDEVADFFAEHDFKVILSFDGVREAQDHRGEGTFDTLDRVLDSLRDRHPGYFKRAVELSVTVPPTAVPFIGRSIDYLLQKGVGEIVLAPVMTPGPGWDDGCLRELGAQFECVLRSSLEHLERTGEVPLLLYSGKGRSSSPRRRSRDMCGIVDSNSWAVDVDGTVSGCALFAPSVQAYGSDLLRACRATLVLGHVAERDLAERMAAFSRSIASLPLFSEKEKKYSSTRRCADCRYFDACVTCPASAGFIEGNSDPHRVPDYYCAFNYASLATRDEFPVQPTDREVFRGDRFQELRLKWKATGEEARRREKEPTGAGGSPGSGRPTE
jgi:sulfatase maturation enzyme AslB (radical SAM superfamily)